MDRRTIGKKIVNRYNQPSFDDKTIEKSTNQPGGCEINNRSCTVRTPWGDARRRFIQNIPGMISLIVFLFIIIMAVFAPNIAPCDPNAIAMKEKFQTPNWNHLMGTDNLGRDVLSRIIYGSRVSLGTTALAVLVIMTIGIFVGSVTGFLGGWVDSVGMRIVDILCAFPSLALAIAVAGTIGKGIMSVMISLSIVWWLSYARLTRGMVITEKERDYVLAARCIGGKRNHILLKHILPNVISPIVVMTSLDVGRITLAMASISFLGLGAQPPTAEWGMMLNLGRPYMTQSPHLMIFPGMMIFIVVLAANLIGDALRDALDPKCLFKK